VARRNDCPQAYETRVRKDAAPKASRAKRTVENDRSDLIRTPVIKKLNDGDLCLVTGGTHAGKSGAVRDIKISKTGHVTITVVQKDGERFKTLAKNVVVKPSEA
jgi:ribosomal protein S4E